MKKEIVLTLVFSLMLISFASAEMIIDQQPSKVYNLGDSVNIPVTIKTIAGVSGTLSLDLLCGTKQINFYKNGINLLSGEEKTVEASLVLTKEIVGESTGTCKIKGVLGKEYFLTNEFKISNIIVIKPNTEENLFEPGQGIVIFGETVKENGQSAKGFIEAELIIAEGSSENIAQKGTINNGIYSINIVLPKNMKAGKYTVKLNAYEVSLDNTKTNKGSISYNIEIKQIPTSLEVVLKDKEIIPGKSVEIKTILHDQTGENIESLSKIIIKKENLEIVEGSENLEKKTGEYLKFPIVYNQPPETWTIVATSNELTAETQFTILENEEISVELVNQTLLFVTNTGNLPYNGTINIRIDEVSKDFNLYLPVDGDNKYELKTQYSGIHEVELTDKNKESLFKEEIDLPESRVSGTTGYAIKDASESISKEIYSKPLFWIFIILILIGITFLIMQNNKRRKKEFSPTKSSPKKTFKVKQVPKKNVAWENRAILLSKESKLKTNNKANLSLSIKGNKQEISVVNINTKNLAELQEKKSNVEEPLQKIINFSETKKAFIYENQNNLTIMLVPSKTRTFKNESTALDIAKEAKEILYNYNRVAKYKIDFGISLEHGSIVEKTEQGAMQFMSLGTLMGNAKKISLVSEGEILLGESIKNKLTNVRTEKQDNGKVIAYKIKDIKYYDEGHSRYMQNFMNKNKEVKNTDNSKTKQSDEKSTDPKSLIRGFY